MEADEDERSLRESPLLVRDAALNGYVKDVLCRTVGRDRCASVRVYVVEVPQFNASMAPNGAMRVWTGLLLRVRNEAQLATVLGHEFAHYELRHSVYGLRAQRNSANIAGWLMAIGGIANTSTANIQGVVIGAFYRFNRQQESDADMLGMGYLSHSEFPTSAAPEIWLGQMAEDDATMIGHGRKPRHDYDAGFFATHPSNLERAARLSAAAAKAPGGGGDGAVRYRERIAPLMPRLLAAQVKSNDFGGTEFLLGELAKGQGWTPDLLIARASLFRQRGNPRDLVNAADFYREAIAKGYGNPVAWRDLGLTLRRNGDLAGSRAALQTYLEKTPDARDRSVIDSLLTDQPK